MRDRGPVYDILLRVEEENSGSGRATNLSAEIFQGDGVRFDRAVKDSDAGYLKDCIPDPRLTHSPLLGDLFDGRRDEFVSFAHG